MKNIGIVLAGGIGRRFGGDRPKQYFEICGTEMIAYSIELFRAAKTIDDFVVVLNEEEFGARRIERQYGVRAVCGGDTRNQSFKNALDYVAANFPDCEKVVENNAACPLTRPETIDEFIRLLDEYDYVQTTMKITDALGSYKDRSVNRDDYFLIQAPDAYRFREIYDCFDPRHPNGHPAVQLPQSAKGYNFFSSGPVLKVTNPDDIALAEFYMTRVGGRKTAITFGVFDLLHYGHFELFRRIKDLVGGEGRVYVMLQSDEWVSKFKDVKLVYDYQTRKKMIETLRTVDKVIPYDAVGVDAVKDVDFDVLVVGPEHTNERFQRLFKWCAENGKEVVSLPRTSGVSTTLLKEMIREL